MAGRLSLYEQVRATQERLSRRTGVAMGLDSMAGGTRLITEDGGRDISPRLPLKHLATWLDGFEVALDEMARMQAQAKKEDAK